MINLKRKISVLGLLLFTITVFAKPTDWKIDSKATVKFVTGGTFGDVHGTLSGMKGTIEFDPDDPSAGSMKVTVDPKTIATGIWLRNSHLRNEEGFFNTSKYPLIHFTSKKIHKVNSGYSVTGTLTIKEVNKEIEIPFTFEKTANGATFKGYFTMDAHDYSLWKSSKKVTVDIEVPVSK